MKKLGLISVVLAGVAFTAVGCASEAGLNASGSAQTSASPSGVQAGVGVDAGVSGQAQPVKLMLALLVQFQVLQLLSNLLLK